MVIIYDELNKMGFPQADFSILQDKDGVIVARMIVNGQSYVLKCFRNDGFKREIENYQRLSSLHIPTIRVITVTDSAILLEDINRSPVYRLGIRADMADPEVAKQLAVWYRQLHQKGYDYVAQHGAALYDEADYFTLDNIAYIKEKTGTQGAPAWSLLEQQFGPISAMLHHTGRTLTYNDFYYSNMVVARDKSSALMFDYNLMGKGYAYSDLRNVTASLSEKAGKVFLEEYGTYDSTEEALDGVVSVVVTLYLACLREQVPSWAQSLLREADTTLIGKIEHLRRFL